MPSISILCILSLFIFYFSDQNFAIGASEFFNNSSRNSDRNSTFKSSRFRLMCTYDLELNDLTIFSACFFFQKADDRLALSNAKSGMFEQRKISLKEAPLIFNLWDNVYHQNGVKNLETNGRWDPSKLAKGMSMSIYPNFIMFFIKFILTLKTVNLQ